MHATHAKQTADYALSSPDALTRTVTFVLLTIQQPLAIVPEAMQDVANVGEASRFLFGSKRAGYAYVAEHADTMLATLHRIIARHGHGSRAAARAATALFYRVPGLGAVKAGFAAQCCGFDVGCIDSHNVARLGIPLSDVSVSKRLSRRTQRQRLARYVDLTLSLGGAATLWDDWCEHVAGTYGGAMAVELETGEAVSAFHARCICGDLAPIDDPIAAF